MNPKTNFPFIPLGALALLPGVTTLLDGINNLLDEKYHSRVRSNGIDPAAPRNFHAGLRFEF